MGRIKGGSLLRIELSTLKRKLYWLLALRIRDR
jgi:hypothetical protein